MGNFFSDEDSKLIVDAIAAMENKTIGEIRVHIEDHCDMNSIERAQAVFHLLHMNKTRERTGVLIYIASVDRKAAVYGDAGIHAKVHQSFWDQIIQDMILRIQSGSLASGIQYAIEIIGKKLIEHFPETGSPSNELSNEISYG